MVIPRNLNTDNGQSRQWHSAVITVISRFRWRRTSSSTNRWMFFFSLFLIRIGMSQTNGPANVQCMIQMGFGESGHMQMGQGMEFSVVLNIMIMMMDSLCFFEWSLMQTADGHWNIFFWINFMFIGNLCVLFHFAHRSTIEFTEYQSDNIVCWTWINDDGEWLQLAGKWSFSSNVA